MRGKPTTNPDSPNNYGITPADAGKTALYAKWDGMEKDHPRGCGENHALGDFFVMFAGSPPRMRGKRTVQVLPLNITGITPADAGKTDYSYTADSSG